MFTMDNFKTNTVIDFFPPPPPPKPEAGGSFRAAGERRRRRARPAWPIWVSRVPQHVNRGPNPPRAADSLLISNRCVEAAGGESHGDGGVGGALWFRAHIARMAGRPLAGPTLDLPAPPNKLHCTFRPRPPQLKCKNLPERLKRRKRSRRNCTSVRRKLAR